MELQDSTKACILSNTSSSSDIIHVVSNVSAPILVPLPIDPGSSVPKPVTLWPGMYHSPVTKALWEARSDVVNNVPSEAISQRGLVAKTPSSSRTTIVYKFSSDVILREQYRNPWDEIRMGKVIEDLDVLAGVVAFKHCCDEDGLQRPLLLVTASVDKFILKKPIYVNCDATMSGAVTWVGTSSIEIQLQVTQSTQENKEPLDSVALVANFTFVARDSRTAWTGKSAPINPISPVTEQDKLLQNKAAERNEMRKKRTDEINKMGLKNEDTNTTRPDTLFPEKRFSRENSMICQPQHRNTQGRIFGGFLMRRAFELAFATAYAFMGARPVFMEIDQVDFLRPVDVGDFLRYKSRIVFDHIEGTSKQLTKVEVVAHVTKPELKSKEISNKFCFTFGVRPNSMADGLHYVI